MRFGVNNNIIQRVPIKKVLLGYYLRWYYNGWHYWFFLPGKTNLITSGNKYRTLGSRKITMSSGQIVANQCLAIKTIMNTREVSLFTTDGWMNIRIEPGTVNVSGNINPGFEIEFTALVGSRENYYSPVVVIPSVPPVSQCETTIGTQIWMCKNWDGAFPASKVYNNLEANRALYGGLYTYDQIMSAGFCPPGWHIPTLAEWNILIGYLGGASVAGRKLKAAGTTYWNTPNTDADNSSGFDGRGGGYGYKDIFTGQLIFSGLLDYSYFWTATEYNEISGNMLLLSYNSGAIVSTHGNKQNIYGAVRLIKDGALTYNDWFLPSKDEMDAINNEIYSYGLGGFVSGSCWTSSEYYDNLAWIKAMGGVGFYYSKSYSTVRVRACRAFMSTVNYNLRDIGPAGGYIFWKSGNNYLEVAPSDQSASQAWSNIDSVLIGTTGTAIGTGQANTTAIINQVGHTDSAAKLCNDLIIYN